MILSKRHKQCLEVLESLGEATAREVSNSIHNLEGNSINERNMSHPRLNELVKDGYVEKCGKKVDPETKKTVTIYRKTKK